MKYLSLISCSLFFTCILCGQSVLESIPDSLKGDGVNAILLEDKLKFTVRDVNRSVKKREYRILVLNKFSEQYRSINLFYDSFNKIKEAKVRVKTPDGQLIRKYKLKDFEDWTGSWNDVTDARRKHLMVHHRVYPHIIEVEYEIKMKGSLFYPIWMPQNGKRLSVVEAGFEMRVPQDHAIRYRSQKVSSPRIYAREGVRVYSWEVHHLPPQRTEPFSGPLHQHLPKVITAPVAFEMDNYRGSMESWAEFGRWIQTLNEDRNTLEEGSLEEVHSVLKGQTTRGDSIRAIYHYMQQNTRYVSIQLGIGGWQPFESAVVHDRKYGDCKALSFYTQSLLKQYDIPAYYTLIQSGNSPTKLTESFPVNVFNHVILTVPVREDTLWLECTDPTNPFGYLGTYTSDRKALMIDEDGGQLIDTRNYSLEENALHTDMNIQMYQNGSGTFDFKQTYSGQFWDTYDISNLKALNEQDQLNWIRETLGWNGSALLNYAFEISRDSVVPQGSITLKGHLKNAAVKQSNRLFVSPGKWMHIDIHKLPEEEQRTHPIVISTSKRFVDSLRLQWPEEFSVEVKPKEFHMDTDFGSYERTIEQKNNELLIRRTFGLRRGTFPVKRYPDFYSFIKEVHSRERDRLVLVNKKE